MFKQITTLVAAAGILTGAGAATAHASTGGHRVPDLQTTLTNHQWKWVDGNQYVLYDDVFGPGDVQNLYNRDDQTNFTITKSTTPEFAWNAYPSLFMGCFYGVCSKGAPLPEQVRDIHSLSEILVTRPKLGVGNDADDFWFNKKGVSGGQPDGAEFMIWINHPGEPGDEHYRTVRLDGTYWRIAEAHVHKFGTSWNYIQVVDTTHHNYLLVNLIPFLHYCEARGWIHRNWTAQSFNAGYEVVKGGAGTTTKWYRLRF
jgi:hypothetical protein